MIENFVQLNKYLEQFVPGSILDGDFYNPDKMYDLLRLAGNPQEKLKIIHVAGTSGKTSTCYYLSALISTTGAKVGLSVSPHIYEVNERVQINGKPLGESEMCALFNEFIKTPNLVDLDPTYFEILVTFAFWTFAKNNCEYAVIEVGLGGLKDATNVIEDPNKVAVITDIGLDHTRILGETIEKITTQKAGIIKNSNHVFCYQQGRAVNDVIDRSVLQNNASLHRLNQKDLERHGRFIEWLPPYQKRNWLLARSVAQFVAERDSLKLGAETETQETEIPGRMQRVQIGKKLVILDGAHNPQKLEALVKSLKSLYPDKSFALLCAFAESKQATLSESIEKLREIADNVIVTEFTLAEDLVHNSISANELQGAFERTGFKNVHKISNKEKAFEELLKQEEDVLLVSGSFYLIAALGQKMREYAHG